MRKDEKISSQYKTHELLAFYGRVKPILADWLGKSTWSGHEAAMLCCGLQPSSLLTCESFFELDPKDQLKICHPLDSQEYIKSASHHLICYCHELLLRIKPNSPVEMVKMLMPVLRAKPPTPYSSQIQRPSGIGFLRGRTKNDPMVSLDELESLNWYFIIGNAVGLNMPSVVPFALLNAAIESDVVSPSPAEDPLIEVKKNSPSEIEAVREEGIAAIDAVKITAGRPVKRAKRQPVMTSPQDRGYFTTDEVAGLTNLTIDTLNTYARRGTHVTGFTPFKRENGKSWQWRNDQQQAMYEAQFLDSTPSRALRKT